MLTRLQSISTTAREVFGALLEPAIRVPIASAWDVVQGAPRLRITLLDDWPVAPLRLVLAWRPASARFALELELRGHDPRILNAPLTGWTSPSPHDPSTGWTLRTTEHGARLMDVDGLGMWLLPPDASGTPRARLLSSFGHVMDLRLGLEGELVGIDSVRGRVDVEERAVVRTSAAGQEPLARFVCDDAGRVRRIERSRRAPVEVDYDGQGRLASVQRNDGASLAFTVAGEHEGRVGWARVTSSTLGTWEIAHPAPGATLAIDTAHAASWHVRVDEVGWPIEQRTPDGVLTTVERDPDSGAIVKLCRGSYQRELFYDGDGAIVFSTGSMSVDKSSNDLSPGEGLCAPRAPRLVAARFARVDSLGVSIELRYDDAGRVTHITRGDRTLVRRAFDLAGRKIGTMLDGQWVDLEWIETGECALVRDARGPCALSWSGPDLVRCTRGETSWSATRDTEGRAVELRGPHGEAMTLSWTRRGKLEGWRTADGLARRYGWHPTGAWMGVQDEVETRAFERDDDGRLVAVPHDDVRIEWHPAGYAARIRGQGLDEARTGGPGTRSTLVTRDGRAVEVLERDALGRVIVRHSGGRPRIALRWSAVGPLESIAWSEPVSAPTIEGIARLDAPEEQTVTLRFEHGAAGGLVAAHDPRGETTFERQGAYVTRETRGDRWVRVGRDEAGFRMALRSSLGLEVQLRRDAGQRIAELSAVMEGETLEVAFAYDPHGREVRRAFGDGLAIELERDALGRVIARRVLRGGRMLDETTYTWRGARLHEEQSRKSVRYAHDEAGRLCWVVPAEGEARAVWSSAEGAYRGPLSPGCRYASCGQPLATPSATFRYDAAGRREARIGPEGITRYAYDAVSRLVRVEEPARTITHTYDALGRRLVTTVSAKPKSAPSDEERESDAPTPREGIVEHVWDGLELLHRVGDYAEPVTHVHADGVLVALRAEGAWWIVLPDMGGQPDALVGTNGEVRWSRAPMTSIGGVFDAHDEGIAKLGVPALAGHLWDPASGLWHALSGDFDPETARYLTPAPLGASAGPWLYAAPPDPLRPRSELLPRASVPPYDELGHDGFDALWLRHVVESVACERDEGARRAWVAMHDDRPPDVTAWMRGAWR